MTFTSQMVTERLVAQFFFNVFNDHIFDLCNQCPECNITPTVWAYYGHNSVDVRVCDKHSNLLGGNLAG